MFVCGCVGCVGAAAAAAATATAPFPAVLIDAASLRGSCLIRSGQRLGPGSAGSGSGPGGGGTRASRTRGTGESGSCQWRLADRLDGTGRG